MKYANPRAFKDALEARIKSRARDQAIDVNRCRQLLIFERFSQRLYEVWSDAVVLKGGYVLELRLERARTTRDVDARLVGNLEARIKELQRHIMQPGPEFLTFQTTSKADHSDMVGDQIMYEGVRLTVQALLAGKNYGAAFHLDVSVADPLVLEPDCVEGTDFFEFAQLAPVTHRVYPVPAHIVEKLHAMSLPRPPERPNSRVKDLVDIGLLARNCEVDASQLRRSIDATFAGRNTHEVPVSVPAPPADWAGLYEKIRSKDGLEWASIDDLVEFARQFLDPVLNGTVTSGSWIRETSCWS